MVAPVRPTGTKAYLRKKVIFIPTGTYSQTAPSTALLVGATALDVTKMFFASSAMPSQSTNMARSPKRIGDGETYEFVGESQVSLGEMRYSFNPQGAAASNEVKAYEKFVPGTTGFLVFRYGIDRDTDLAVGQFVTSYPCECGPQLEVEEGDAEGAEMAIVQPFAQTGPKSIKIALLA